MQTTNTIRSTNKIQRILRVLN